MAGDMDADMAGDADAAAVDIKKDKQKINKVGKIYTHMQILPKYLQFSNKSPLSRSLLG